MTITATDVLKGAKVLLETKGWIQGNYCTPKGFCLTGAMSHALPVNPEVGFLKDDRSAFYSAVDVIADMLEGAGHLARIETYNDAKGRTQEDILNLLNKAIEKAGE